MERDERPAQTVVAKRIAILDLSTDLQRQQAAHLAQDNPNRLLKHRAQLELLDRRRRIYSVSEHMAISVLPRSVLAGELYSSPAADAPNADQLRLDASPTRRAMTMAGNRTPRVDKNVASILAEVFTAWMSPKPTVVSEARLK